MSKALELLEQIKSVDENKYHKTRTIIFNSDDIEFLQEAIAELESQKKLIEAMKCCGNCEHESVDEDGISICNIGCFALSKWELSK